MMHRQELFDLIFNGTIEARLDLSRMLYERFKAQFHSDSSLQAAVKELQAHAECLARHMEEMEMGKTCVACYTCTGGGCCSLTFAGEIDAVQLVMNMLMGVEVEMVRHNDRECCFLGERGCIFTCKPMFCLNYNCGRITTIATHDDLQQLHHLTGKLLSSQYGVETKLLGMLTSQIR